MRRRALILLAIVFAFGASGCGSDGNGSEVNSPPPAAPSPNVPSAPTITSPPQPQTAPAGSVVTFSVAATGAEPLRFQWRRNGVDIRDATGASLTLLSVQPEDSGAFSVVVSNTAGSVASNDVTLTVTASAPTIASQPESRRAPVGSTVKFTVEAHGTPPLAFQWRRDGIDIDGANGKLLTLLSVAPDDSGVYTVVVSNTAGSVTSVGATLAVDPLPPPPLVPPAITSHPESQSAVVGESVTFNVQASGTAPFTFQWRRDDVDIPGATGASLTLLSLGTADSGVFAVVVSNAAGSVTSADAVLSVEAVEPPPPPLGAGSGLTAEYYDELFFSGARIARTDATIDFVWGSGSPDPAVGADTFSVRWIGQIEPRFSETYTFHTVSDDGVRLLINNQVIVDKWIDQPATEWTGSITLIAGQRYEIVLDYYENRGAAQIQLFWSSASQPKEIVPATQLYPQANQAAGAILREVWLGIPGKGVADLTGSLNYPDNPDVSELIPIFEGPTKWADNYGTRIQGYVHAPMTGFYVFWLATDDTSELYLSGNENPNNKRLIAHQASFAEPREWNKHASQQSQPVFLEAGRRYYIEALQKEGTGGDNVAVGWQLPDGFLERPVPGHRLSPWP